jgi:geranylgeranyl diphosphate synthase type I
MTPAGAWTNDWREAPGAVERALMAYFNDHASRFAYGELFEPLYHDLAEFTCRRGKRLRPLLFLASYRALGGTRPWNDPGIISGAVALEFLHAFILIHDDVIDRSDRRRNGPSFHKLVEERLGKLSGREMVGRNTAIVMGDFLFALALDALARTDFPEPVRAAAQGRFYQCLADTGAGEAQDILLAARDISRVTEEEIAQMYRWKTTQYTFEAPLLLGGLLAGVSVEVLETLKPAIEPLGLAFQIENDLAEFARVDPTQPGRSTDLIEGKKTLLIHRAYERLTELDRSFLQMCLNSSSLTEGSVLKVRELVRKSGAVQELRAECEKLRAEAHICLQHTPLDDAQKAGLLHALDLCRSNTAAETV